MRLPRVRRANAGYTSRFTGRCCYGRNPIRPNVQWRHGKPRTRNRGRRLAAGARPAFEARLVIDRLCAAQALAAPDAIRYNPTTMRGQIVAATRRLAGAAREFREGVITAVPTLPISNMEQRHAGLTQAIADSYAEAAGVCLDRHHQPPTVFDLDASGDRLSATALWRAPDERTRRAWANRNDATEAGAYACILAAVELAAGLVAVRRAETMTGADYYVACPGNAADDLESCLRLEVSGVDRGPRPEAARRLAQKLDQLAGGASNLPAMAGVIGFEAQAILLAELRP